MRIVMSFATIAEQLEKKTAPERSVIVPKYRQAMQRSHNPQPGDATLLIELGRQLGLSDDEIAADARAWEEARSLVSQIPTVAQICGLAVRRTAAQQAVDEVTVQTAGVASVGITSGKLTAATADLRNVESQIKANDLATYPALMKLLAVKQAHPLVFDTSRRVAGAKHLKIKHTMVGNWPRDAVIDPIEMPDVLPLGAPMDEQETARNENIDRLIGNGAIEWTDEALTTDLGDEPAPSNVSQIAGQANGTATATATLVGAA